MSELASILKDVERELGRVAEPERVQQMEAYMKDQFSFLGVRSPARKAAQKPLIAAARSAGSDDVLAAAEWCWARDARELQYVGADLLRARATVLRSTDLGRVRLLITTKSWWDTVDTLAAHTVAAMVTSHPELSEAMDAWIDDDDMWIARTAILHQLNYKDRTDEDRLFEYARCRAPDTEFFIRKALGWALRNYARTAPDSVRQFVADNDAELSGLTKREATKHL